ncbi:hypothetical protein BDM02DRAFT_3101813 [Thelephora ganbajun]|uniref:Uncharacterized protein n=1 Tax=Thelephora ganbajun TaxID=370292 RepID=A0ACB6Z699_THEGA|nr:hypothetical protein BDM02DRAFT_3101813 [Thelephora ganbajun]
MHSDTRLDSPPPPSRFRRPWSPDPLDSFNSSRYNRRREPSDVSVEALDLADYAMSLPRRANRPHDEHYNPMPNDPYPPSPQGIRQFAQSRDSLHPPSLTSPGDTLSTTTSTSRSPRGRPWSLPPRSYDPHTSSQRSAPRIANRDNHFVSDGPHSHQDHETEIDTGRFPAFARHWYPNDRPTRSPPSAYHSVPTTDGISPFDPTYPTHKHNSFNSYKSSQKQQFPDLGYHSVPPSYDSHSRNLLPWVNEPRDPLDEQLHPDVKKERIRMLEREFAGAGKDSRKGFDDENMIGSADRQGRLITQGPKKRLATRCFQALLTLGAAICLIYIALAIKPKKKPPPQGTIPIYVLYAMSIITFLLVTYLFLIFPYCCLGRGKDSALTEPLGPEGMMVLPVQYLPGGSKRKGSKGKKKSKGRPGGRGDVQVNLIVDPNVFGGSRRGRDGEEEYDDEEHSSRLGTNSGRSSGSNGRRSRTPKRRSVFAGLALEARWKKARRRLKWAMAVDVVCFVMWGAEFVVILVGQRCPPGGFDGWCDGYNLATALVCLTCLLFGFSVFFDIKDLHGSRVSPRTRT